MGQSQILHGHMVHGETLDGDTDRQDRINLERDSELIDIKKCGPFLSPFGYHIYPHA